VTISLTVVVYGVPLGVSLDGGGIPWVVLVSVHGQLVIVNVVAWEEFLLGT